mgnify:FL=1
MKRYSLLNIFLYRTHPTPFCSLTFAKPTYIHHTFLYTLYVVPFVNICLVFVQLCIPYAWDHRHSSTYRTQPYTYYIWYTSFSLHTVSVRSKVYPLSRVSLFVHPLLVDTRLRARHLLHYLLSSLSPLSPLFYVVSFCAHCLTQIRTSLYSYARLAR